MKRNSVLSCVGLTLAATSLFIFSWKSQIQSSVHYENRRQILQEMYYNTEVKAEPQTVQASTLDKSENVSPIYTVGEQEVCGIQVTDLKIYKRDIKQIRKDAKKKVKRNICENRWGITLTDDEIKLLAKIVWVEARGESNQGQRGVIEVIFNRMKHRAFKGSLYDVLSAKSQFSSWSDRNAADPTEKEYKNINKVLNGNTEIFDFETVYFSTSPRNNDVAAHIGGHWFCRYEYK